MSSGKKPKFEIQFVRSVLKDLKHIDKSALPVIKKDIESLAAFPDAVNIKKLIRHPVADYRLRSGDYRILFDIDTKRRIITILKIGHRKDIYE